MNRPGILSATMAALLALAAAAGPLRAEDRAAAHADARAHYEKATAAYALGHYADAAAEFEQAFALKPDPAILYNAAQAYRLAGKKERALELYRNYRRAYGRRAEHAPDVDKHIAELDKAIESDKHAAAAQGAGRAEVDSGGGAVAVAPAPPPQVVPAAPRHEGQGAAASLVTQPAPPPTEATRPLYGRWWFWAGAGVVVAGAIAGVLLATRKSPDCGGGVDYCVNTGL